MKQVNIHQLLCEETFADCINLIDSVKNDERLLGLNAIVFLLLKPKGNRNTLTPIKNLSKYKELIDKLFENDIKFGFDSCTANNFLKVLEQYYPEKYKDLKDVCEPCESSLFSYYINVDGIAYPCSFSEGIVEGIDLKMIDKFDDVWKNKNVDIFRTKLLNNNRSCPLYNLEMK